MSSGKKRKQRRGYDPKNEPRQEKAYQGSSGRPEDPDRMAAELEQRSGGSIPADVARRVARQEPGLANAIANELGLPSPEAVRRAEASVVPPEQEIPAAFRRPQPGTTRAQLVTGGEGLPSGLRPGDIIATEQPLGYTETDIDLPGGTTIKAGSKVYRADPEAARRLDTAAMNRGWLPPGQRNLVAVPGEPPRQPDVIVTDDLASLPEGTDPGLVLDFTEPGGSYPGQVLDPVETGSFLPPGFEHREPDPPQVLALRAADVLAMHAGLTETMRHPPAELAEYFDFFIGQELGEAKAEGGLPGIHSKWAGSFWPAKSAQQWCGILARQLSAARTYQVSAPMARDVMDLYRAVRRSGKAPWIDRADVPWPAGFAWLDLPLDFRDRWDRAVYTRAVSWDIVYLDYEDGRVPGVRAVSWSHPADRDAYWDERAAGQMQRFGGLSMDNSLVVPFGQRLLTQRYAGYPESDNVAAWLKALWHVMESEISVTAPAGDITRPVRKRALRSLRHGEVHVVLLRRKRAVTDGETGPRHVNWTCRWPVDGFWRHARRLPDALPHHAVPDDLRGHCAVCGAKVSWVGTYIKGPPGLPLKQDKQLYRLTR